MHGLLQSAPTLWQATANPCLWWRLLNTRASRGQSFVGSLLLSPGSWCTHDFVCALQKPVSPVLCKFWLLYGGLMVTSSKRAYGPADLDLHRRCSNTVLSQSLRGLWILVHTKFVWALWTSPEAMGFDSKCDFAPPTILLGLLLCPWTQVIFSKSLHRHTATAPAPTILRELLTSGPHQMWWVGPHQMSNLSAPWSWICYVLEPWEIKVLFKVPSLYCCSSSSLSTALTFGLLCLPFHCWISAGILPSYFSHTPPSSVSDQVAFPPPASRWYLITLTCLPQEPCQCSLARVPLLLMFPLSYFLFMDPHPVPWLQIPTFPYCVWSWALSLSPAAKPHCRVPYTCRHSFEVCFTILSLASCVKIF